MTVGVGRNIGDRYVVVKRASQFFLILQCAEYVLFFFSLNINVVIYSLTKLYLSLGVSRRKRSAGKVA